MKKALVTLLTLCFLLTPFCFAGCAENQSAAATIEKWKSTYTAGEFGIRSKKDPFVEFTFSTGDKMRIELYPSVAPISVENFLKYVEDGFYENVAFHRIIAGFMIQTGGFEDKDGKLVQKTPTYPAIKGEFLANGVRNDLSHKRGVISMARTTFMDSATSQFFICSEITQANIGALDGRYAAFGRVIDEESMAVVLKFEALETGSSDLYYDTTAVLSSDVPTTIVKITKATVVKI